MRCLSSGRKSPISSVEATSRPSPEIISGVSRRVSFLAIEARAFRS